MRAQMSGQKEMSERGEVEDFSTFETEAMFYSLL